MSEAMKAIDLFSELEKWQAYSHAELADLRPRELFEQSFVEHYNRLHNHLWQRMIRLHGTIHTIEQLRRFPLVHLYAPDRMEFWRLVIQNFLDTAILMLHGLVNDAGQDVNSLPSFRDQIINGPWLSQDKCDLLKQALVQRKFDGVVKSIAKRVDVIRDNRVAHQLVDKNSGNPKEILTAVSREDLRRLFDASHSLFGALSFGATYITLAGDLTPTTVGGKLTPTCLDGVLDAVLRDSNFVNNPERRAQSWPRERGRWTLEDLRVMNDLRGRIGLPEA